jgi:carbamate kinase
VYKRTGDGSGFAGTWVSSSEQVNSVVVLKVRKWEGDGLSFISQGGGGTKNVKFDGKDYANVGAVIDGLTASARRVNARTLDMIDKIRGKVTDKQEVSVSADGKTLTITIHIPAWSQPDVQVFERE